MIRSSICTLIFLTLIVSAQSEQENVGIVPRLLMKAVELMNNYLGFLNRCPLEIVQFLTYMQTGRPMRSNDICTLGGYHKNSPVPFMYFECVPSEQNFISIDMGEYFGITNMMRQVMNEGNGLMAYANNSVALTSYADELIKTLSGGTLAVNFSLEDPSMRRCGVYTVRHCSNGSERFNFFAQQCVQDSSMALSFQMYLTLAKINGLLMLPGKAIPTCISQKIPDAIQYLLLQVENRTEKAKAALLSAVDTHQGRISPLLLLFAWAKEYMTSVEPTESEESDEYTYFTPYYMLVGLKDIGFQMIKQYASKLLTSKYEQVCARVTPETLFDEILKVHSANEPE